VPILRRFLLYASVFAVAAVALAIRLHDAPPAEPDRGRYETYEHAPVIQVRLVRYVGNTSEVAVATRGSFVANGSLDATDRSLRIRNEAGAIAVYDAGVKVLEAPTVRIEPLRYGEASQVLVNERPYLGAMRFVPEGGYVRPVNAVPLEDYLKGVVPYEMSPSWALEALKAQAVAARTYALSHGSETIDDTIQYQVYAGYAWHPNAARAVDETAGQTLRYGGKLIPAVYSASNGGVTESNANAWGGEPLPLFPIQEDPYDPVDAWSVTIRKTQIDLSDKDLAHPEAWWSTAREADARVMANMKRWLSANVYPNAELKIVAVPELSWFERTSGGRVRRASVRVQYFVKSAVAKDYIRNEDGTIKLHEYAFAAAPASRLRAMIGLNEIKSYLIDPATEDAESFRIAGRGNGHGVGMSQWGAKRRADAGQRSEEILAFYYPGATLTPAIAPPQPSAPQEEAPSEATPASPAPEESAPPGAGQPPSQPPPGGAQPPSPAPPTDPTAGAGEERDANDAGAPPPTAAPEEGAASGGDASYPGPESPEAAPSNEAPPPPEPELARRSIALAIDRDVATVNGEPFRLSASPFLRGGRTMVPLRFVSEQLGAAVHWNETTGAITVSSEGTVVTLRNGSRIVTVNGTPSRTDAPPTIVNGRAFVPLRFVSERLGANVRWEASTRSVSIDAVRAVPRHRSAGMK